MFDLLIKQPTIIDGTGAPGWVGDVGIKNERFVAIEHRIEGHSRREIQAEGLVLAPGFIDIHCHSDVSLLNDPLAHIKLKQGVTREVIGNCGTSLAPLELRTRKEAVNDALSSFGRCERPIDWLSFSEYGTALENLGLSVNVMGLVGHGLLRIAAMGFSDQTPTYGQLDHMKNLLARSMEEGAMGMSTGLIYAPGIFAKTEELIALSTIIGEKGGFYASHIRNEAEGVLAAIDEVIRIGREARVPVHISHLKITGKRNWFIVEKVVEKLQSARADGLDLTCDVYPYYSSSTSLTALIPPWAMEGGVKALISRLKDTGRRARIIREISDGIPGWENMYHNAGWDKITVSFIQSDAGKHMEGKTIGQLAREDNQDPFQLILNLIEAEEGTVKIISETMNEKNVSIFLKLPFVMVGSDSQPTEGKPHPRLYGTFPRVIRRFVRELKILTMEEAIWKMTGLTAQRLGLRNTGTVKPGLNADAVLFDPKTFSDTATYNNPSRFPEGLQTVIVNGIVVIEGSNHTGATPGIFHRK